MANLRIRRQARFDSDPAEEDRPPVTTMTPLPAAKTLGRNRVDSCIPCEGRENNLEMSQGEFDEEKATEEWSRPRPDSYVVPACSWQPQYGEGRYHI
jgi:hypothetical protein